MVSDPPAVDRLPPSGPASRPAPLPLRVAAMTYEAVLLFGVVFIVTYLTLALLRWEHPLTGVRLWTLQAILFVAIGIYFVWCWHRSGQTLAMKTWHLRLLDHTGRRVSLSRAIVRYVLAWHLFVPGFALLALFRTHEATDLVWLAGGFAAMLLPAVFDAEGRLLHDRVLGTHVIHQPPARQGY
ncbi:MAG TPA: RDD family protein [Burkholderiaceae bacterium]|nr:RDD family protein [Burkholderiaceae bacterium]